MIQKRSVQSSLNLNRLVVFAAVVEAGSLTGAAKRLGLTKTAVSSHVGDGANAITRRYLSFSEKRDWGVSRL